MEEGKQYILTSLPTRGLLLYTVRSNVIEIKLVKNSTVGCKCLRASTLYKMLGLVMPSMEDTLRTEMTGLFC